MSVSQWVEQDKQLYRNIRFPQYKDALDFVMKVGRVAELKNHHPKLIIDYLSVDIYLFTHDEQAITDKDKDLAIMIDQIVDEMNLS